MSFLLLLIGLAGLWIGTELALRGTITVAERRGLSEGFLGLTVLAIGSDLPEFVVAVTGGVRQLQGVEASGLVVGNAVGSAITQGTLVLGVAGLFVHLRLAPRMVRRDGLVLTLSVALLALVGLDGRIGRTEGGVLLVVYLLYFGLLVQSERRRPESERRPRSTGRPALGIVGGLFTVLFSADLVVVHGLSIAERWSVDQTLIGVLLVGVGTSLPELALSLGAAAKRRPGLSVGNVIGSNVFDLLVPVGVGAALHPLSIHGLTLALDLPFLLLAVLGGLALFVRRRGLQRGEAVALIGLWLAFAVARIALSPG